ncbi:MAG: hypothetical protein IH949_10650 [Bacteroidetes bacterium]|nr:hypothetical protein [Bacteroidota bacterium]
MENETKETTSGIEAEKLQKSGKWELLSAVIVGVDSEGHTLKNYKFKKGSDKAKEQKHIVRDPFSGKEITDEMEK